MKRLIPFIVVAILSGVLGWTLGARYAFSAAAGAHNAASLVFFTAIHQSLVAGNIASAKKMTEDAISAHISVIENSPKISIGDSLRDFISSRSKKYPDHILRAIYHDFAKQPDSLSPEAMSFLKSNAEKQK